MLFAVSISSVLFDIDIDKLFISIYYLWLSTNGIQLPNKN